MKMLTKSLDKLEEPQRIACELLLNELDYQFSCSECDGSPDAPFFEQSEDEWFKGVTIGQVQALQAAGIRQCIEGTFDECKTPFPIYYAICSLVESMELTWRDEARAWERLTFPKKDYWEVIHERISSEDGIPDDISSLDEYNSEEWLEMVLVFLWEVFGIDTEDYGYCYPNWAVFDFVLPNKDSASAEIAALLGMVEYREILHIEDVWSQKPTNLPKYKPAKKTKPTKEKFCYLMKHGITGDYKIGISQDPKHREKTLFAQDPRVKLIWSGQGGRDREKFLHDKYASQKLRGEWFSLTKTQVSWIAKSKWPV